MTTRAKKTNSPSGSMPPGTRASKNGAWSPPRPRPAAAAPPVLLVAIAGGSGSGKTWLAAALRRRLHPRAGLISLDDFYRDLARLPVAKRRSPPRLATAASIARYLALLEVTAGRAEAQVATILDACCPIDSKASARKPKGKSKTALTR